MHERAVFIVIIQSLAICSLNAIKNSSVNFSLHSILPHYFGILNEMIFIVVSYMTYLSTYYILII